MGCGCRWHGFSLAGRGVGSTDSGESAEPEFEWIEDAAPREGELAGDDRKRQDACLLRAAEVLPLRDGGAGPGPLRRDACGVPGGALLGIWRGALPSGVRPGFESNEANVTARALLCCCDSRLARSLGGSGQDKRDPHAALWARDSSYRPAVEPPRSAQY